MMFYDDPQRLRDDLGEYPDYLYDNDPFNDVQYLLEKEIVIASAETILNARHGMQPGMAAFDD